MGKAMCQFQIRGIARDGIHVGKHFVQAAMLAAQHVLHLFLCQSIRQVGHPVGQLHEHVPCFLASGHEIGIAQPGVSLVDVVERHPTVVQAERIGPDIAVLDFRPHLPASGHTAQITVARRVLATLHLGKHVVQPTLDFRIARGGIHVGKGGKIMPADMPVQSRVLPIGIVLGLRRQSGTFQIRSQQTVGVDSQQIADVQVFRMLERTLCQSHAAHRESFHLHRDLCLCRRHGHSHQSRSAPSFHYQFHLFH